MKKEVILFNDDKNSSPVSEKYLRKLKKENIKYIENTHMSESDYIKDAISADIILNHGSRKISHNIIEKLPRLQAIVRRGIGYDNIDIEAAKKCNVCVSNTPGFCTEEVSTHAVSLLLAFIRRIPYWNNWVKSGQWEIDQMSTYIGMESLHKECIGVIGFGRIGRKIVEKLIPFNPKKIYVYDPYITIEESPNLKQEKIDVLMEKARYIILSCPITEETYHIINRDRLNLLSKESVIINVGRGKLIDEVALIDSLKANRISGAALDVFEDEPIKSESSLLVLDNVILTPHNASDSPKSMKLSFEIAIDEILRIVSGKSPQCRVN